MKKILGLTIAAMLIIGLVVGGTLAYFTDTETITVDTFTAGTIDLEVTGGGALIYNADVNDMKPCETGYLVVHLTNAGTNDFDIWKKIEVTDTNGGTLTEPEDEEQGGTEQCNINEYIHFDMWTTGTDPIDVNGDVIVPAAGADAWIIEESNGFLITANAAGSSFTPPATAGVAGAYIYLGTLAAGEDMYLVQSFHLDGSVTNWAQGDCLTLTETLFAQQNVGNPPAPDPELPGYGKS